MDSENYFLTSALPETHQVTPTGFPEQNRETCFLDGLRDLCAVYGYAITGTVRELEADERAEFLDHANYVFVDGELFVDWDG